MLTVRQLEVEGAASSEAFIPATNLSSVVRLKSQDLFQQKREVEIDHDGRIYRLRVTQLNKLILTA